MRVLAERIFRGFLFLSRSIFSRIFSPDSSHFCGEKSAQKNQIPGKILHNLYNKNPRHISALRVFFFFFVVKRQDHSMLIRLPLPQCFCPRERKLRPWSEKNSDQTSDHPRLCIYWGNEKLRPWSEFLGRENSDHGLSFGCFWGRPGRGRRGVPQSPNVDDLLNPRLLGLLSGAHRWT